MDHLGDGGKIFFKFKIDILFLDIRVLKLFKEFHETAGDFHGFERWFLKGFLGFFLLL